MNILRICIHLITSVALLSSVTTAMSRGEIFTVGYIITLTLPVIPGALLALSFAYLRHGMSQQRAYDLSVCIGIEIGLSIGCVANVMRVSVESEAMLVTIFVTAMLVCVSAVVGTIIQRREKK